MNKVELGVLLPTREAIMSGRPEAGPLLDLADRAEASGYDSVWVGDSLLARPRFEPLTLLAAVAARTRRVTLGTAVLLPALRPPLLLAHAVSSLDRVAEGRLVLGVGIAPNTPPVKKEFEAVGVPFDERIPRLEEALALCRRLWSIRSPSDRVSVEGKYWTLDRAQVLPTPHRPGGPPLWMGGNGPRACQRAGRMLDGWFPNTPKAEDFRAGWAIVQDTARAAKRSTADLSAAFYATVNLNDDAGPAQREMTRFIEAYYAVPFEVIAARQACYAGSAAGCLEWLTGFVEAGARHIVLRLAGPDQVEQFDRATAALLGRLQVNPAS